MRACPLTIKLSERRRGMRETTRRAQLTLEWTDAVQWDELPVGARLEVCGLLRELLRQAALCDPRAEAARHE
jgi:hypothetical protein